MQPRRVTSMNTVLALPPTKTGLGLGALRFELGIDFSDACQNISFFFLKLRVLAFHARRVPVAAHGLEDVLGPRGLRGRHVDVVAGVAPLGLGDFRRCRGPGRSGRQPRRRRGLGSAPTIALGARLSLVSSG